MVERNKRVCPLERAGTLDLALRKWVHNPKKILQEFVKENMVVLDVGCGTGYFTVEIAKMVGDSGKVIAADLQEGMINKVKKKIEEKEIEKRIQLHKCNENKIGVSEEVDLILAFYMVHEVPNENDFLKEVRSILKPDGILFIVEPKFHVSKKAFKDTIQKATALGFETIKRPRIYLSRAMVLRKSTG